MRAARRAVAAALLAPALAWAQAGGQFGAERPTDVERARSAPGFKSDWEERQEKLQRREDAIKLPGYPRPRGEGLIPFRVDGGSSFKFFIDPASVEVGNDRIVRYTLVAISPSGYENVTFEGIRCTTGEYRVYARGADGRWTGEQTEWKPIEQRNMQRWHHELRHRYFCVYRNAPVLDTAEALDALERGGHKMVTDSRFELQR